MSFADALLSESANTSQLSAPHAHNLSAYSQDDNFTVVPVDDLYFGPDTPSANARTVTTDKFFIDTGGESKESEGNDARLTGIVKSPEVLYLRETFCGRMTAEMERYEPSYNLANHTIRQLETSKIPSARGGACKSKRKPGIAAIWDGHVSVANGLWNHDEVDPSVNGGAGLSDGGGRECPDRKGKYGNEKKGVNRFVHRDGKVVQCVADKEKCRKILSGDFAPLASPTPNPEGLVGSVNGEVYFAGDVDDLMKKNAFRSGTTLFDEMSKPVNRICRATVIERPAPLKYVKYVDHFKQAIRDVVLAHHLVFSSELCILHRDISIDSLMVRYSDANTLYGVLIDFDLAMMFGEITQDHMGTRTRSRPFMAWELLESDPPPIHLERFDWESFFYVICWIGCHYSEGKEVNRSALSHWYEPDDLMLSSMKWAWLFGPNVISMFTTCYGDVALDWAIPLQMMFRRGNDAKYEYTTKTARAKRGGPLKENFDEVTVGGEVTWDKFWGILQN